MKLDYCDRSRPSSSEIALLADCRVAADLVKSQHVV